jgi:hypothetical protein
MEFSRIKQLEHLEPLEPSSHHLRIRINQCWSFFHFDDLDSAHTLRVRICAMRIGGVQGFSAQPTPVRRTCASIK